MPPTSEVFKLDSIIEEVSNPTESECGLLREHLESARNYHMGQVPEEYLLNIRLARENLNCVTDGERRKRMSDVIDQLLAQQF